MCTSAAPASRSIRTWARWVLPRTIESSTTTRRLPRTMCSRALSLSRMPSWRSVGLDGELPGQLAPHLHAGGVHALPADGGVGSGQVDVLEDAALARGLGEPV